MEQLWTKQEKRGWQEGDGCTQGCVPWGLTGLGLRSQVCCALCRLICWQGLEDWTSRWTGTGKASHCGNLDDPSGWGTLLSSCTLLLDLGASVSTCVLWEVGRMQG